MPHDSQYLRPRLSNIAQICRIGLKAWAAHVDQRLVVVECHDENFGWDVPSRRTRGLCTAVCPNRCLFRRCTVGRSWDHFRESESENPFSSYSYDPFGNVSKTGNPLPEYIARQYVADSFPFASVEETAQTVPSSSSSFHAFLYSVGKMVDLGAPGAYQASAAAIHNSGQIAGGYYFTGGKLGQFLYSSGKITTLPVPSGASAVIGIELGRVCVRRRVNTLALSVAR